MHTALRPRRTKVLAALAAAAVSITGMIAIGGDAGADPKQASALTGVGSDTTQDVMNAMAGFQKTGPTTGTNYTPIQSSAASGLRQVASWDATGSSCITPKAPGATFNRPNGSTGGRKALSRAIDLTSYGDATCGGAKPMSGLVNFARSSAGPSGVGSDLTYIPFGRDALAFGYYRNNAGATVTNLTTAQLTSLFSTGPQTISGVDLVPCSIQTNSGTYQSWNTLIGVTPAQMAAATASCTSVGNEIQENDGNGLKTRCDALPAGKQCIIGFSAANFIAQSNGVVQSQLPSPTGTVDLGGINGDTPYAGVAPALTPDASFYAGSFGRLVYNVVPTAILTGLGNDDLKTTFVGAGSSVCGATARITAFGFLTIPGAGAGTCGNTSLVGPLVAGSI